MQAIQAGIVEIPDVVVVDRRDSPGAERGLRRAVEELAIGRLRDLLGRVARSVAAAETLMSAVAARRRDQVGAFLPA